MSAPAIPADAGPLTDTDGRVLDADREQAEAEASLRAARTLFLEIELFDGLSLSLAVIAGNLAANILQHLCMAGPCGYRESETRVGEAREMLGSARELTAGLRYRYATGYETVMADDAIHELEEHLARLERDDLRLRTGDATL